MAFSEPDVWLASCRQRRHLLRCTRPDWRSESTAVLHAHTVIDNIKYSMVTWHFYFRVTAGPYLLLSTRSETWKDAYSPSTFGFKDWHWISRGTMLSVCTIKSAHSFTSLHDVCGWRREINSSTLRLVTTEVSLRSLDLPMTGLRGGFLLTVPGSDCRD